MPKETLSNPSQPDFTFEKRLRKRGFTLIAGIDEVGRGPLAGPVTAAAVILDPKNLPQGLNDSKMLSAEQREALYDLILARALAVAIACVGPGEIDRINIRQATLTAMRRTLPALALAPHYVLVDGNDLPEDLGCPGETIIKGDARSLSIAAASIVAKVARDRLMQRLSALYPAYGFENHVGYATQAHLTAIEAYGPCPIHRLSFSPFTTK
ncbi:ribonuclease HII [Beijerinckia indica]|uniref:Ribonuclease HII n=1 Tax=Beijerinckia indica subsp. indica (strain ATCC 9039 / DSM 1715 / NCIMB 8712) TaxID=395963 RepID=B2IHP9_BEII9|nr:ribonuclease HII [Beijerinckia indica]ACB94570.1 Ribonuclease H [Beijerinckia indica subsp. indica ATCC 9039]